jgi:phosphoribosylanthranilate isomerase
MNPMVTQSETIQPETGRHQRPLVKICGLTRLEDALAAIDCGADMLGFILVPASPRYIAPAQLQELISQLPEDIVKVGVFQDHEPEALEKIMRLCRLNVAQLHGHEPAEVARQLGPERVWKMSSLRTPQHLRDALAYPAAAILVDAPCGDRRGGTGLLADWQQAAELARQRRTVLAGGLTPENIVEAIERVHPWAVDLCSGVEASPGRKDLARMKTFFRMVNAIGTISRIGPIKIKRRDS